MPPPTGLAVSLILPTRNRPGQLIETLESVSRQSLPTESIEVIIVDDGSKPPVDQSLAKRVACGRVLTTPGVGRSSARNRGAGEARGRLLVFVDDDMSLEPNCVEQHLVAHQRWAGGVVTGAIRLPVSLVRTPFGRFRQALEDQSVPSLAGPVQDATLCAAGNMSIAREDFHALQGFDPALSSSEDQDLALRHAARGGRVVYWPAASGTHRDSAVDVLGYCRRSEWGMETLLPFCRKHPTLPANVARHVVNGPTRVGGEAFSLSLRKVSKSLLSRRAPILCLHTLIQAVEVFAPSSTALDVLYRLLLGVHLQRGYRRGLAREAVGVAAPAAPAN